MPMGDVRGPDQSAAISRQRILPRRTNSLTSRSGASLCATESPSESEAFFGRFSNELDRSHRLAAKSSTCSDVEQVDAVGLCWEGAVGFSGGAAAEPPEAL